MLSRRTVCRVGAALVVIAIVLFAGFWILGSLLVAPANRYVGPPPDDLPVEVATVDSRSGSSLATWYIPAEGARATVVLVHGIHADRRIMLDRARMLHELGYAAVLIDLRAHGESPGNQITFGHLERFDVQAAVDFARRRHPDHRIGLIGVSMGGAAALLAPKLDLDALVIESVYPAIRDAVNNRARLACGPLSPCVTSCLLWQLSARLGVAADDLRPVDRIAAIGCPVLIATGANDALTTLADSRRLYAAAAAPKEFITFSDAGHEDFLARDPAIYRSRVAAFFAKHLDPSQE